MSATRSVEMLWWGMPTDLEAYHSVFIKPGGSQCGPRHLLQVHIFIVKCALKWHLPRLSLQCWLIHDWVLTKIISEDDCKAWVLWVDPFFATLQLVWPSLIQLKTGMDEDRSLWNSSCIQMAFGSLCRNAAAVNDLLLSATTLKHLFRMVLSQKFF